MKSIEFETVILNCVCDKKLSCFEDNKKNLKKIWSGIRSTLNMKNTKVNNEYSLLTDKDLTTNERDLANHFNTFFISVAQKLVNKIPPTNNNFENFMKNQNKMSFIGPVDTKEI